MSGNNLCSCLHTEDDIAQIFAAIILSLFEANAGVVDEVMGVLICLLSCIFVDIAEFVARLFEYCFLYDQSHAFSNPTDHFWYF